MNEFTLTNAIYEEIGVEPVIHAAGTKTTHGGTRSDDAVFAAMTLAGKNFVSIEELNRKVGSYIARITGAESGMVTCGAGSAMVLSIAACMTGCDHSKIRQLPNSNGMKNEMVVQKIHVGNYTHMYTFAGAKIIEVGNINDCKTYELESAITENTAAIHFLLGPRISQSGLDLVTTVNIAHKYQIPVIVDAAAMLPPKSNLNLYIEQGADLVAISGGKMIHGPQGTGILYGKKELIDAAIYNASPYHAIGRPHKVSKEEIVGLYVALKKFMMFDEDQLFQEYRNKCQPIIDHLQGIKGINATMVHDQINYNVPVVVITFNSQWTGPKPETLPRLLLQEKPRIFLQFFKELQHLVVNPISLQDGENIIVAITLRNLLLKFTSAFDASNIYEETCS